MTPLRATLQQGSWRRSGKARHCRCLAGSKGFGPGGNGTQFTKKRCILHILRILYLHPACILWLQDIASMVAQHAQLLRTKTQKQKTTKMRKTKTIQQVPGKTGPNFFGTFAHDFATASFSWLQGVLSSEFLRMGHGAIRSAPWMQNE